MALLFYEYILYLGIIARQILWTRANYKMIILHTSCTSYAYDLYDVRNCDF